MGQKAQRAVMVAVGMIFFWLNVVGIGIAITQSMWVGVVILSVSLPLTVGFTLDFREMWK